MNGWMRWNAAVMAVVGAVALASSTETASGTANRVTTIAAADSQHWVVDSGVAYSPWTFDLTIDGGTVTGAAHQALIDSASSFRAPSGGPFSVYDGTADGDAISFKLKTVTGGRIITFHGVRHGDQIAFTRTAEVVRGDSGRDGIVGAKGATQFTATLNGKETKHSLGVRTPNPAPPSPAAAPTGPRQTTAYSGVTVDITAIASASDRDAVLDAVHGQIDIIDHAKMSPEQRAFFKSVPIVMKPPAIQVGMTPGAYSSATKTVVMNSQLYDRDKPILLHELLHAYHDQKIPGGFGNTDILGLYAAARAGHRFPDGSYMLSNVVEYFAMMASVYLHGSAARDPFTRDSIRIKQPECYQWLEKEFGAR